MTKLSATNAFGKSGLSPEAAARLITTYPPALDLAARHDQIQLNWPADHTGWKLEAQTHSPAADIGTNWTIIANSTATNNASPPLSANGSGFFRLVYPRTGQGWPSFSKLTTTLLWLVMCGLPG